MSTNQYIFISPHFDDVVLSCGALIWDLTQHGNSVEIWTIMGGYPHDEVFSPFADLTHQSWGCAGRAAIDMRREEDRSACSLLGAEHRHFDWQDVIHRRDPNTNNYTVNNNTELFGNAPEAELIVDIAEGLQKALPKNTWIVLPIGLGGHIDHRAVVQAGKLLESEKLFFADYPYILKDFNNPLLVDSYRPIPRPLFEDALQAWQKAVLCYQSQVGDFWRDEDETRLGLRNYFTTGGGRFWKQKTPD